MILLLTMMILMTFAIWFVQFCALIIHCQFCHGQVYTSMGFKHKTGAGDLFLMTIILLLMLSLPNIWKRIHNFTFYLSDICLHRFHFSVQSRGLCMLLATWPSWIGIEKVEKVHGKAREKKLHEKMKRPPDSRPFSSFTQYIQPDQLHYVNYRKGPINPA